LIQAGIVPDMVIGTSIGAVNAVAVALEPSLAGMRRLLEASMALRYTDVVDGSPPQAFWNMVRGRDSLFANDAWLHFLQRFFPDVTFDQLPIPAYTVATNLETGAVRVFGDAPAQERIFDGMMASSALAPFYPAWSVAGIRYVDGASRAVLPLRQAVERGAQDIIAFNLTNQKSAQKDIQSALEVMQHSLDLMLLQQVAADLEYVTHLPDVRLTLLDLAPGEYVGTLDTTHTADLVVRGRQIAKAALPEITQTHFSVARRFFSLPEWWPARAARRRTGLASILPWIDEW
jgi:NTE family protein